MGDTAVNKSVKKVGKVLADGKNFVANNPVTILKAAGVIAGIYLLYQTAGAINDFFEDDKTDNERETTLDIDPDKLTITEEKAKNWAATLFESMKVANKTDEDAIRSVFDIITPEDFKLIHKYFGTPHYDDLFGSSPLDNFLGDLDVFTGASQKRDLVYWLKSEVSSWWDYSLYNKIEKTINDAGLIF